MEVSIFNGYVKGFMNKIDEIVTDRFVETNLETSTQSCESERDHFESAIFALSPIRTTSTMNKVCQTERLVVFDL